MWSWIHSLEAIRERSLGRVERCPRCFRQGSDSSPVLADLREQGRGCRVGSGFEDMGFHTFGCSVGQHQCLGCKPVEGTEKGGEVNILAG